MLYNDSGKAPSVVRNLRGELVFEEWTGRRVPVPRAPCRTCSSTADPRPRRGARRKLDLPLATCARTNSRSRTSFSPKRERLLREPVDRVISLVEAVNGNLFARLVVVDAATLTSAKQSEAAKANEVEALVHDRKSEGFGIVAVPNASSVLCRVAPDKAEAHAAILGRLSDRIGDELPSTPVVTPTSADGAFIAVKRGECGAVYASAADLASIDEAMSRDGLSHRYLPLWIEPSEIIQTQTEIDHSKTRSAEEQFKRQRELDDRRRLDREKERDENARRETQERALRAQYGERHASSSRPSARKSAPSRPASNPPRFMERYPKLARHYQAQRDDRWEFMSVETHVLDYGTALYKDRPLETALATTRSRCATASRRVSGRLLRDRFVNDAEFGVVRDNVRRALRRRRFEARPLQAGRALHQPLDRSVSTAMIEPAVEADDRNASDPLFGYGARQPSLS